MGCDSVKEVMRKFYRTTAIFNRDFRYPGYSLKEAIVLGIIVRHPGIIARDISGYYAIDRGHLSKILKKMEERGLIVREHRKRPPFEKLLSATPRGEQVCGEIGRLVDRSIEEHLSGLTKPERAEFFNNISALLDSLNKIIPDYRDGEDG